MRDYTIEGSSNEPKLDVDQALEFVKKLWPDGPWPIVSLPEEGGRPHFKCLKADDQGFAARRIEAMDQDRGNAQIVFNDLKGSVSEKPKRENIQAVRFLFADIDPDYSIEWTQAQTLLDAQVQELLEGRVEGIPIPTVVIHSGGGRQLLWALAEPVVTKGDLGIAEDIADYGRGIAERIGGDSAISIDRSIRLPGTVNYPDAKKRAKGRIPAPVKLLHLDMDRKYSLDDFPRAAPKPKRAVGDIWDVQGPTELSDDLRELDQYGVTARIKQLAQEGDLPGKTIGDGSRSDCLYYFACEMVRDEVPAETIKAVITDDRFGISDSVLNKPDGNARQDWERNADRQIERAFEGTTSTEIEERRARKARATGAPQDGQAAGAGGGGGGSHGGGQDGPGGGGDGAGGGDTPRDQALQLLEALDHPVIFMGENWYEYRDGVYDLLKDGSRGLKSRARTLFPHARSTSRISNVVDAAQEMEGRVYKRPTSNPGWFDGRPDDPHQMTVLRNGMLNLDTGEFGPHDSEYFTTSCLEFDYDPEATCPRFMQFLAELWPDEDEQECPEALRQIIKLIMRGDTSQHIIPQLVGQARSGKSTIARIIEALVGTTYTKSVNLNHIAGTFSMEGLVGRKLGLVADFRLGRKTDKEEVIGTLLRISGEDLIDIKEKYKAEGESARLRMIFFLVANEALTLRDEAGALQARYRILQIKRTFEKKEDRDLKSKLLTELPGILNWVMAARPGEVIQPKSGIEMLEGIERLSRPVRAFVEDMCILDDEATTERAQIYEAFKAWSDDEGKGGTMSNAALDRDLPAATDDRVSVYRPRIEGGKRPHYYKGIRLREPNASMPRM